jgi:hypothetical protein
MKSHFADEERLRETKRDFGSGERIREQRENAGQIHIWEVSLRRRRENSEAERDFGKPPSLEK